MGVGATMHGAGGAMSRSRGSVGTSATARPGEDMTRPCVDCGARVYVYATGHSQPTTCTACKRLRSEATVRQRRSAALRVVGRVHRGERELLDGDAGMSTPPWADSERAPLLSGERCNACNAPIGVGGYCRCSD